MGLFNPIPGPRNAFNSYYKHAVWWGCNEHKQIPQWQHKDLFQYNSDAGKLGLFLACWSSFPSKHYCMDNLFYPYFELFRVFSQNSVYSLDVYWLPWSEWIWSPFRTISDCDSFAFCRSCEPGLQKYGEKHVNKNYL